MHVAQKRLRFWGNDMHQSKEQSASADARAAISDSAPAPGHARRCRVPGST
ncbi:hypothetical protein FJ492_08185 [Mesorhizobium sp. B2-5-4]|nr:hypothetical protein FJ492_08185 [Mesorhizobium sp. B2-5-4]TPM07940.1 hypothetical protein FJ960_08635 [Mesorhizobium sp. B2-3-11]